MHLNKFNIMTFELQTTFGEKHLVKAHTSVFALSQLNQKLSLSASLPPLLDWIHMTPVR